MRSLLLRSSPGLAALPLVPCVAYASCMYTPHRTVFIREFSIPAALERGDKGAAPVPARLLWQFSSKRPRHLVLSVKEPLPAVIPPSPEGAFEDLSAPETTGESATQSARVGGAPPPLADFLYGRLFLRPYNVAQLLTVLQGWSDSPAVMERERSCLTLSAVRPSVTSAEGAANRDVDSRPSEVMLTARFTRKTVPASLGDAVRTTAAASPAASADAAAHFSTDEDMVVERDYPDSVYLEGDMGTLRVRLRDADLTLLTNHLESVLSDLFAIEHCSRRRELHSALGGQYSRARQRPGTRSRSSESSSAGQPKYISYRYASTASSNDEKTRQRYRSRSPQRSRHNIAASAASSAATEVQEGVLNSGAKTLVGAMPARADHAADDGDFEEMADFEEMEDREGGGSGPDKTPGAAMASTEPGRPSEAASVSATYATVHTRDGGRGTIQTSDRYTDTRLMRDSSVDSSKLPEMSRVDDIYSLHRTREKTGATEADDSQTTMHATATTGAFRSPNGEMVGILSHERSAASDATSGKAAATHAPLSRETSEGDIKSAASFDDEVADSKTMDEVVDEAPSESESHVQEKEAAGPLAVQPSRKRQSSSNTTAAGKKKTAKKKSKKAVTKRKTASSTSAGGSTPPQKSESADTLSF